MLCPSRRESQLTEGESPMLNPIRNWLQVGFVATVVCLATNAALAAETQWKIADGPFVPTWESLMQYECPDWFRDAKFGIWAHWSAQCVPEQGDWYARRMYQEGDSAYKYHLEHYGHPSKVGFKDICNQWKAENWDPAKLVALYKRAGAKYFVALGNHHCNFDCWNSKYQPWNSVNIGPKKDIVGLWADGGPRRTGLRFGVTIHAARAWDWFDVGPRRDTTGPLAGVPYDGVLTKADGKGQWWEGFDPAGPLRPPQPGPHAPGPPGLQRKILPPRQRPHRLISPRSPLFR